MNEAAPRPGFGRRDVVAVAGLLAIVLALTLPAILTGQLDPKAYDHRFFHLPLVREWAASWPRVDLRDYNSATGPLYHWLMAGAAQIVGAGGGPETSVPLQTVNSLFGWTVGAVVYAFARRRWESRRAFLTALPLVVSPYLLGNAIWMMTDNLSLTLVAAAIGSAAFGTTSAASRACQGANAALAVATRQINLWLLAPMAASWWLGGRRRPLATILAMAAPVAVLAVFVALWKGLVPPRFRTQHASGLNPAAIGFALVLTAAYGAALLPLVSRAARTLLARPATLLGIALLGAALAGLGPSFAGEEVGRNGGWVWRLVAAFPTVADRSPIILFGGAAGAQVLGLLFVEIEPHGGKHAAMVLLAAFAGFLVAHVANAQIFQRYYDPMVLLTLVWLTVCLPSSRRLTWCLGALAVQQFLFTCAALYGPMLR